MKALPRYQHLRLITAEQHAYGDLSGIATAAYYKAERRGFVPGHELDDWLVAEREVRRPFRSL